MSTMMGSVPGLFGESRDLSYAKHPTQGIVLAGMETAVLFCKPSGQIENINASASSLLNGRQNLLELCNEPGILDRIALALQQRLPFEEIVEFVRNKSTLHIMLRGRWLDAGSNEPRLIVEGTDITELRQREKQLRVRLCRDELTGIAARRYFLDVGQRALLDTHRYGRPLSVLMLDLDDFKTINDNHGHAVGDQFLCFVTEVCTGLLRRNDLLGRLGGDEFAALLPSTAMPRAKAVATRLHRGLADAMRKSPIADSTVTLSIGIAGCERFDRSIHDVIDRADKALYKAKRSGRNVIRSSPETVNS